MATEPLRMVGQNAPETTQPTAKNYRVGFNQRDSLSIVGPERNACSIAAQRELELHRVRAARLLRTQTGSGSVETRRILRED